jgi:hypothetical protein
MKKENTTIFIEELDSVYTLSFFICIENKILEKILKN